MTATPNRIGNLIFDCLPRDESVPLLLTAQNISLTEQALEEPTAPATTNGRRRWKRARPDSHLLHQATRPAHPRGNHAAPDLGQ
jgi:hypothetical protein